MKMDISREPFSLKFTFESILVCLEEVDHYREIPNWLQYFSVNSENTSGLQEEGNGSQLQLLTGLSEKQW
jgi:hypothetical protein